MHRRPCTVGISGVSLRYGCNSVLPDQKTAGKLLDKVAAKETLGGLQSYVHLWQNQETSGTQTRCELINMLSQNMTIVHQHNRFTMTFAGNPKYQVSDDFVRNA
jgi:hypothetical protein